jgi:rod shape-determining protein MreB
MHPLRDGVISDYELTVKMLQILFRSTTKSSLFTPKPRVILRVPSGITEMEERTMINAVIEAGARRVYLMEAPLAAALGAGLDIKGPNGHMLIDIGAGTTDIAVLTMSGVANASSLKTAGNQMDEAIISYVRRNYNMVIGATVAEEVKVQIGAAYPRRDNVSFTVRGRDLKTSSPNAVELHTQEITDALQAPIQRILDEISNVLENTSPELVADIAENGITLTGGGSQIWGMARYFMERTGINCTIADDPDSCAVHGCGKSLAWINHMSEGPINIARRRLLNMK